MEFLVNTHLVRPAGTDDDVAALMVAERARAAELMAEGTLKKLWRVPGKWGAWALYGAPTRRRSMPRSPRSRCSPG